jgi:hypothetical protein
MREAFEKRHPRKRLARKPGHVTIPLANPSPRYSVSTGHAFFCARVAVREPVRAQNSSRRPSNRLAVIRYTSVYYKVKQYDYVCFKWGELAEPPIILSQWPSLKQAAAALIEAFEAHERS